LAPLTPIFEYNYPVSIDPNHYSDFAVQQTNSGSHTTYDNSAFSVSSAVVGNGDNLPAHQDIGLNVSVIKQNWETSTVPGTFSVLNIVGRQGLDDMDGITENVSVNAGYAAGLEGNTESFTPGTQTIVQQMDYQLGEIETGTTGTASANGLNLTALVGTLTDGLLIQANAGAGWTDAIKVNANSNGVTTFTVTPLGAFTATSGAIGGAQTSGTTLTLSESSNTLTGATIVMTGSGSNPNKTLEVNAGKFQIDNSANTTGILSLDDLGNFQVAGVVTATGYIAGSSTGVTCSGTPTSSFAAVGGIVTHC
jgi:hypothetical protein